jgi:hypothetical protein
MGCSYKGSRSATFVYTNEPELALLYAATQMEVIGIFGCPENKPNEPLRPVKEV